MGKLSDGVEKGIEEVEEGLGDLLPKSNEKVDPVRAEKIREVASHLLPTVEATIGEIFKHSNHLVFSGAVSHAWEDVKDLYSAGNPRPRIQIDAIETLLTTFGQTLIASGEAAGLEGHQIVHIPGGTDGNELYIGASGCFIRQDIKDRRLQEAHPDPVALFLMDGVTRYIAMGLVEDRMKGKKQARRGKHSHHTEMQAVDANEVEEKELVLYALGQKEAAILVNEAMLNFRDTHYPGQDITAQMVLEAILWKKLPTDKITVKDVDFLKRKYINLRNVQQSAEKSAVDRMEQIVAGVSSFGTLMYSLLRSGGPGFIDAVNEFKVAHDISLAAEKFEETFREKFFANDELALHGVTLASATVIAAMFAHTWFKFLERHNPVDSRANHIKWPEFRQQLIDAVAEETDIVEHQDVPKD